jgi:hypothetical protein
MLPTIRTTSKASGTTRSRASRTISRASRRDEISICLSGRRCSFGIFTVDQSPVSNPINCASFRFILLLPGVGLWRRRNSAVYIEGGVRVAGTNMIRRIKMLSRNI